MPTVGQPVAVDIGEDPGGKVAQQRSVGQHPHGECEVLGGADPPAVREHDERLGELHRSLRLDVEVSGRSEIIMLGPVALVRLHVEPLPIGEAAGDGLPHLVVSTRGRPEVDDDRFRIPELADDLVDRPGALCELTEPTNAQIADGVGQPGEA